MTAPLLNAAIQGQGTVSADNLNTYIQNCTNIAQLRSFIGLPGMCVFIDGLTTQGDGGSGPFYWNTTSIGPDNGTSVVVPQPGVPGAWIRLSISQGSPVNISTISNFEAFSGGVSSPVVFIEGYYTPGDGGGGIYVYIPSDTTSPSNGGTIIIDAANNRYYLETMGQQYSVLTFGAVGNGTTDNTIVFNTMEETSYVEFYVPQGIYYVAGINQGGLVKQYTGPGYIKYGSNPFKVNEPQCILNPAVNPLTISGTGISFSARSIVFIGDSITAGYPVGYFEGYPSQINQILAAVTQLPVCSQIPFCDFDYVSTSGTTSIGTTGPIGRSLILSPGASFSFTADYVDFISLFYAQSSSTTTTISITGNSVTENLTTSIGTNPCVEIGSRPFRNGPLNTTYTVTNTGSNNLEINGVSVSHFNNNQGLLPQVMAYPGYTTANYSNYQAINAILMQTFYGATAPVYVIALGANDAFSPTAAIEPSVFKSNLQFIVSNILAGYNATTSVILLAPFMPYNGSASQILAPFSEYRDAMYQVARQYSCSFIDGTEFDLNANSAVLRFDDIHPNQLGYAEFANWLYEKLGFGSYQTPVIYSFITPVSGITQNNNFIITCRNKKAIFNGFVAVSGSVSYPLNIGAIVNVDAFFPLVNKFLNCASTNGAVIVEVSGSSISAISGPATPGNIYFDGITYSLEL